MTYKTMDPTLEQSVNDMINNYREAGRPLVHLSYASPDLSPPTPLSRSLRGARDADKTVIDTLSEPRRIDRKILLNFGYEGVPFVMRPIEAVRRLSQSFFSDGKLDTTQVVAICGDTIDRLVSTHGALSESLKSYARVEELIEGYAHRLEDHAVDVSEQKEDTERSLETMKLAIDAYRKSAPLDGSMSEKFTYQRSLRAMEKDERSLKSLNLRLTQDLNQTMSLISTTKEAAEVLEVSKAMNYLAADKARGLVGQLKLNVELYQTNAETSDLSIELGKQLHTAARLSDLLTNGTHTRMNAVGSIIKDFTVPGGRGGDSISRGGLVDGLKSYLEEMQQLGDEEARSRIDSMLP